MNRTAAVYPSGPGSLRRLLTFAAAACVAGVTSWRSVGRAQISEPLRTLAFVGSLGALAALLFAFALAMQGWASLVLSGCER